MPPLDARELRRIAFVTQRFVELQGLVPAMFGALLLFDTMGALVAGGPARLSDAMQPLMLPAIFMGALTPFLQASYRRTFGDVVSTWHQKLLGGLPTTVILVGGVIDMGFEFGTRSGPSFAAIALAAYSIAVLVRDWPWRPHQLIAASAGVAGAIVTAAVPAAADRWGADPARAEAFLLAYVLMGVGMVASGLCDHHLLARSMGPGLAPATPAPVSRAVALRRAYLPAALVAAAAIPLWQSDDWLPDPA